MGTGSRSIRMVFGMCLLIVVVLALTTPSLARVTRIEITEKVLFAEGMSFGDVGPYWKIRGNLYYAVDPDNPHNRQIVDLDLAKDGRLRKDISQVLSDHVEEIVGGDARNGKGEVEFWGTFILLTPVDPSKGNHRLLYDVNNRGSLRALGYYNDTSNSNNPTTVAHAGNGWLMRQGYSILWSGWNWDVESPTSGPQRIFLPIIVEKNGKPLVERINAEIAVQNRDGVTVDWVAWGNSRCYHVADNPELQAEAILTVRDLPDVDHVGPRTLIPREDWQFAVLKNGVPVFDPVHVYYPKGFEKGRIYELIYHAKNPRVVGLGLAAIRDAISFFHFETQDEQGNLNPLAVSQGGQLTPDPEKAYIFGISQSGRVIVHMIYQGFHVDEQGRMVFEGARPHVAGGGKGAFNYRWAQTTHHPKHIEGNYFPADYFPFNYTPDGLLQVDPYRHRDGQQGDVLAVAKALGKIPKIMVATHELEYWTRAASLVYTNVFGTEDAALHPNVRGYMVNGAPHGTPGNARTSGSDEHSMGSVDQRPMGRALLVALDEWVTAGVEPPPTTVPNLASGTLITVEKHKAEFPLIPAYTYNGVTFPALRHPGTYLKPPRVNYGPKFFMPTPQLGDPVPVVYKGLQNIVPPEYFGPPYETRVPAFDTDGNGLGGIRAVELRAPLGTYQGWNPRKTGTGAENFLMPFDASFWPFALTKAEREANGDSRLSIEERYGSKEDYLQRVITAASTLLQQRFILTEDFQPMIDRAARMVWPPVPLENSPFWKMAP